MDMKDNLMPPDVWVMHNQVGEAKARAAKLEGFIRGILPTLSENFRTQAEKLVSEE